MFRKLLLAGAYLPVAAGGVWVMPAYAQDADGEIIVTARRREETLIDVPVAITAVSGAELARRGVNSIDGIARLVPQLIAADGGTVTGGNIALRGIGGSDNPFGDQAVSFNIDGVQVARAAVRRMANMDMQQVEVLKGPQALFYGKNSPGGVISIRTGDPTAAFEGKASVGYETNAREWRGEGYVAGPLTDTLGFRVAAYGSKMRGWVRNTTPASEATAVRHGHSPRIEEFAVRGTLRFEPTDAFDARLKLTYGEARTDGFGSNLQLISCPTGAPQAGHLDDCRGNDRVAIGALPASFSLRYAPFGNKNNQPNGMQRQILAGLEMNYRPSDSITLSSVTGLYSSSEDNRVNVASTYVASRIIGSRPILKFFELSQELRVTSNFDGPINFMMGTHLQSSRSESSTTALLNGSTFTTQPPLIPVPLFNYRFKQKGEAYSAFLQMQWDIFSQLQLSVGGRYSYEKKRLPVVQSQLGIDPVSGQFLPMVDVSTPVRKASWNDFSPEVTLSYRPSRDLTVYGSYKHGFISGGFNSGSTNFVSALDYGQQTVKGFEGGVKTSLLDGAVRANLALYTYDVRGLQVTINTNSIQELKNVGKVRTKGGEFDISYRTPIRGLSLTTAIAYNDAKYIDYFANCYRGLSKAGGCSFVPVPGQPGVGMPAPVGVTGSLQNLAGGQLVRAPEWTGNVGFDYETPVGTGLKLGLSSSLSFSSSYFADATSHPNGRVPRYQLLDATLRLADHDDRWEIAVIGRNLTESYYWVRAAESTFTGTPFGNESGPAIFSDLQAPISRGREVMVRLTTKF